MAIQKINQNFGATLKGDYIKIIDKSAKYGLTDKYIKKALRDIHEVCQKKEDKVYLYYRDMYKSGYDWKDYVGIRSGVKVYKDGEVMELNVNPNTMSKRYLFPLMALKVKQLVTGKIKPDEKVKLF